METDLTELLPEDVLAGVLRRLPPHSLAAARCVCKAWRAIIDARRLFHLLPLSLAGIFIDFHEHRFPEFFARPSTGAAISGKLDYIPTTSFFVEDHCNGLLLLYGHVVNPATRRWAILPPRPPPRMGFKYFNRQDCIVFDPTISPHYEVFTVPHPPYGPRIELDPAVKDWEWPPSPFMVHVFSSATCSWEERSFIRQGDAIGTVADMQLTSWPDEQQYAVYWQGELYVHRHFVMRLSSFDGNYQVIKLPSSIDMSIHPEFHLGRSEKGVYAASLDRHTGLRVWFLNESCGQIEWVLKLETNLDHVLARRSNNQQIRGPWTMEDINYAFFRSSLANNNEETIVQEKFEWNSDNENVVDTEDRVDERYNKNIVILGFHPYKEVVFLSESLGRGLAYHLNSSKLEDLGSLYPTCYSHFAYHEFIYKSFPYTPCWAGEFPDNN